MLQHIASKFEILINAVIERVKMNRKPTVC